MATRRDAIREYIKNLRDYEQVNLWNDYCEAQNYDGDRIGGMEEFDDLFYGLSPLEIVRRLDSSFNPNHAWFYFDGYGDVCSTNYPENEVIQQDDIAEYIDESGDSLYDSGIAELLKSWDEDDEDDEDPTDYDSEPDDDEDPETLPA